MEDGTEPGGLGCGGGGSRVQNPGQTRRHGDELFEQATGNIRSETFARLRKDGRRLLEQLLQDPDLGIEGDELRSGEKCHPDRRKEIQTVLGTVGLKRSCFYRPGPGPGKQGQGRFPLDQALGLNDGYSAGMAKMMCRAGAMASGYEAASADLKACAGLVVEGRQIQRMVNLKAAENGAGHVLDIRCAVMNRDFEGFRQQPRNSFAQMKKAA